MPVIKSGAGLVIVSKLPEVKKLVAKSATEQHWYDIKTPNVVKEGK